LSAIDGQGDGKPLTPECGILDTGGTDSAAQLHRRERVSWFPVPERGSAIPAPDLSYTGPCPNLQFALQVGDLEASRQLAFELVAEIIDAGLKWEAPSKE